MSAAALAAGFFFATPFWPLDSARRLRPHASAVGDVIDEAVGQHLLTGAAARGDDRDEEQVAEAGTVGHHERAERGALEAVLEQRLEPPNHQQRRGEKQREVGPHAGESGAVDDVGQRIHRRAKPSR